MFIEPTLANATNADILWLMNEAAGFKMFSILSHLVFFAVAVMAWVYTEILVAILCFLAGTISTGYHLCGEYSGMCMGVPLYTWRLMDRLTANAAILSVFALYMAARDNDVRPTKEDYDEFLGDDVRKRGEALGTTDVDNLEADDADVGARFDNAIYHEKFASLWIAFSLVVLSIAVLIYGLDNNVTYMVTMACILSALLYNTLFYVERTTPATSPDFILYPRSVNAPFTILFVGCAAIAIMFFTLPENGNSFKHSMWHIFAALAVLFALFAKHVRPPELLYQVNAETYEAEAEAAAVQANGN